MNEHHEQLTTNNKSQAKASKQSSIILYCVSNQIVLEKSKSIVLPTSTVPSTSTTICIHIHIHIHDIPPNKHKPSASPLPNPKDNLQPKMGRLPLHPPRISREFRIHFRNLLARRDQNLPPARKDSRNIWCRLLPPRLLNINL